MKLFVLLTAAFIFVGCNSAHKHHHNHDHEAHHADGHKCDGKCASDKKDGEKKDCQCQHSHKPERKTSSETTSNRCSGRGGESCESPSAEISNLELPDSDLKGVFDPNHEQLSRLCYGPAAQYCGKVSRSTDINFNEFKCLWKMAHRTARDAHPFDTTKCSKKLISLGKK